VNDSNTTAYVHLETFREFIRPTNVERLLRIISCTKFIDLMRNIMDTVACRGKA